MTTDNYDIVIIGGGVMGSSVAFHLMDLDNTLSVAVFEKDPTYKYASTALSWGNIRIQFSLKENIQISRYTLIILKDFEDAMAVGDLKPYITFRQEGNLFLHNRENRETKKRAFALQKEIDGRVEWWSCGRIQERFPLFNMNGIDGGIFSPDDGYVDGYSMLMGYKNKARALGASYINREVTSVRHNGTAISGIELDSGEKIESMVVVNCAGAWASQMASTTGVKIPIVPTKRQVFAVDTKVKPKNPLPLTVLPTGLAFRSETGNLILVGKGMEEDPVGIDFACDDKRFTEILWPELAEFVPAFDTLKIVRGWSGLYAINTMDGNAVLGEWPELKGFYCVNGFSGHGLQQAPAVGRYISELITDTSITLDLSIFGPERILNNKPLDEHGLV